MNIYSYSTKSPTCICTSLQCLFPGKFRRFQVIFAREIFENKRIIGITLPDIYKRSYARAEMEFIFATFPSVPAHVDTLCVLHRQKKHAKFHSLPLLFYSVNPAGMKIIVYFSTDAGNKKASRVTRTYSAARAR